MPDLATVAAETQEQADKLAAKLVEVLEGQTMPVIGLALTRAVETFVSKAQLCDGKGDLTLDLFLFGTKYMCEDTLRRLKSMSPQELDALKKQLSEKLH